MPLTAGTKVGPYEVVGALGTGGMGEVYRASDSKLKREVALKVLPEEFANDPQRMARFEREAQVLASLNHSNIAAIYGLEESSGTRALVMELVEGPTLRERIVQGPLSLEDALPIAKQIAEALEYAHEHGIIHRDLKPENIKLAPDGQVKLLDFGLAKALEGEASAANISTSPTISMAATRAGMILGTAGYMSPEQAKGKPVDRRADIWAFGCVLFEMLTNEPVFVGETATDILAAVVRAEPVWARLPKNTPLRIRELLHRCLQKDLRQRLQAIGDARITVEEILRGEKAEPIEIVAAGSASATWRRMMPWAACAILLVALVASLLQPRSARDGMPQPLRRLSVQLPEKDELRLSEHPAIAISSDGRSLVYAATRNGVTQLYLRLIDQIDATPLEGTTGGSDPFFSPDGQWVGFFTEGKLKKVSMRGGSPVTLCEGSTTRGASWAPDDTIVFAPSLAAGLQRINAAGGTPKTITTPDNSKGERTHRWPEFLPGGKAILYTVGTVASPNNYDDAKIVLLNLQTGENRVVIEGASMARYSDTGHLVYARAGGLFATPFDLEQLRVTGPAVPVLRGVASDSSTGAAHFAVGHDGSLVYVAGVVEEEHHVLVWVDGKGNLTPLPLPPRAYLYPRISPDGTRIAFSIGTGTANQDDVWIYDIAKNRSMRLTFDGRSLRPVWSPDGRRVAYRNVLDVQNGINWQPVDGSAPAESLYKSQLKHLPESFTPDGEMLLFTQVGDTTQNDIWRLPVHGDHTPQPVLQTRLDEVGPSVSPDGHWMAYGAVQNGRNEIFVEAFPGPGAKWQISTEGGNSPIWGHNGKEIFFRDGSGNKFYGVPVQVKPTFSAGAPRLRFQSSDVLAGPAPSANFDVSLDGQRLLMVKWEGRPATREIRVVLNWSDELLRVTAGNAK